MRYNDIQEIAGLVSIRNFLASSIENLMIKLSKDDVKNIQTKIGHIDRAIVDNALKLDLSGFGKETVFQMTRESTEDTEVVLNKISKNENSKT